MFYVYRLIDFDNKIMYVGRTINLTTRYLNHKNGMNSPLTKNDKIAKMEYIKLSTKTDMFIYELFFINAYKPRFNTKDLMDMPSSELVSSLSNVNWEIFDINKDGDFTKLRHARNKYNRKKVLKFKVNKEAYNFYKKKEGLFLRDIANCIGVSVDYMSRLFSGGFHEEKLCKMCEILKCDKEDLICEEFRKPKKLTEIEKMEIAFKKAFDEGLLEHLMIKE